MQNSSQNSSKNTTINFYAKIAVIFTKNFHSSSSGRSSLKIGNRVRLFYCFNYLFFVKTFLCVWVVAQISQRLKSMFFEKTVLTPLAFLGLLCSTQKMLILGIVSSNCTFFADFKTLWNMSTNIPKIPCKIIMFYTGILI